VTGAPPVSVDYPFGAALDGNGREQAHMGVAVGDYDNDGRDDIHITKFADDFNVLYHNHDGTSVTDVSYSSGVAQVSIPFLGWGTDFFDYDNDGWLDLLVVNGHVYPAVDTMPWNTSYAQRALLFRNLEGKRFEEIGAAAGDGLSTARVSRGSAVGDLDNDGRVDVVINNIDGAPTVARGRHRPRRLARHDRSEKRQGFVREVGRGLKTPALRVEFGESRVAVRGSRVAVRGVAGRGVVIQGFVD
jgi:hypothetical protein